MSARMRKVSPDTLELLSYGRNRPIEVDYARGIDVCEVDGIEYFAAHDEKAVAL